MGVPEDIVVEFRRIALERVGRVEQAWASLLAHLDEDAASLVHREVHTLKGESGVVGFTDVNLILHKLEDLLDVARARGYAVDGDFDLAVNMALRFVAMLVRKPKTAGSAVGVDIAGFVAQIEAILKRHEHAGRPRTGSVPPLLRTMSNARVTSALREQLGTAAVDAFLEYAVARGVRRDRLRSSWHMLRDLIGIQRAVLSAAQLGKYEPSVKTLARELGKQIDLRFELVTAEVTIEVLAAVDVATLHLVRNAVDHGIESPAARVAAGKPATGTIRLHGGLRDGTYTLTVDDDGSGIDFERVHHRAIELGLAPEGAQLTRERLVELMCHPGFSTRSQVNEVSGRGVGLDVVRGSAVDLGGSLTARSEDGRGTTWTVSLPVAPLAARGHALRAPGLRFPVVLGAGWRLLDRPAAMPMIVDLAAALGMAPSNSISTSLWWFASDQLELGIACGGRPNPVDARRLVATPPSALAEIVTIDGVEGMLLRPERLAGL